MHITLMFHKVAQLSQRIVLRIAIFPCNFHWDLLAVLLGDFITLLIFNLQNRTDRAADRKLIR